MNTTRSTAAAASGAAGAAVVILTYVASLFHVAIPADVAAAAIMLAAPAIHFAAAKLGVKETA